MAKLEGLLLVIEEGIRVSIEDRRNIREAIGQLAVSAQAIDDAAQDLKLVFVATGAYELLADAARITAEIALNARQMGPWAIVYEAVKQTVETKGAGLFGGPPAGTLPAEFYSNALPPEAAPMAVLDKFSTDWLGEI